MENNLTEQQVRKIIQEELQKFKQSNLSFRSSRSFDSVKDQYSPITGASQQVGFYGTNKVSKQTITGSKGSNAALTSLISALATIGLITDNSS